MIDKLLADFVVDYKFVKFEWGKNDCITFATDWVKRFTGKDYRLKMPDSYSTELEAYDVLKKYGFESTTEMFDHYFTKTLNVKRGDLVIYNFGRMNVTGVCTGNTCIFLGSEGLISINTHAIENAWEVK